MPKYVDGFVIPVPKKNIAAYLKAARLGAKLWTKYGAIDYLESVGDDLKASFGAATFKKMMKLKPGETVVFSYIVFKSRKHRDQVNAKVMKDPVMKEPQNQSMPFDMKRMVYGGFKVIVDV